MISNPTRDRATPRSSLIAVSSPTGSSSVVTTTKVVVARTSRPAPRRADDVAGGPA
ncbi:hypothetical protein ABZ851_33515 [Streptomyces sp. NPDC047049]|uniref:hypothetical protein n=1 Tax=Streptomyces sp. NPDC047049 TaxID=3156688 RepID=UPI0033F93E1D